MFTENTSFVFLLEGQDEQLPVPTAENYASFSCIRPPQAIGWLLWVFNKLSTPRKRGLFHPWSPWVGERIPPPNTQAQLLSPQGCAVHVARQQLQWE